MPKNRFIRDWMHFNIVFFSEIDLKSSQAASTSDYCDVQVSIIISSQNSRVWGLFKLLHRRHSLHI